MKVTIDIHFSTSAGKALKSGSFPLSGRKPEQVAYEFFKWIQKKQPNEIQLEEVIIDGNKDITDLVKELEQQALNNTMDLDLPF
jgi:hypothetical protein